MQSGFSIRITGTYPAKPALPPPEPAFFDVSLTRICRGVRQLVWEALILAGGQLAEMREKGGVACQVRQISMYVCHVALRVPMGEIALACGRNRTTVIHACHVTEDRRDDPLFDAFVACVERMAVAAFARQEGFGHG